MSHNPPRVTAINAQHTVSFETDDTVACAASQIIQDLVEAARYIGDDWIIITAHPEHFIVRRGGRDYRFEFTEAVDVE